MVPDQKWRGFSISELRLMIKCKMSETAPKFDFDRFFWFWSEMSFTYVKTAPRVLARLLWRCKIQKVLNVSFHWKKNWKFVLKTRKFTSKWKFIKNSLFFEKSIDFRNFWKALKNCIFFCNFFKNFIVFKTMQNHWFLSSRDR